MEEKSEKPCVLHLEVGIFATIVPLLLETLDLVIVSIQSFTEAKIILSGPNVDLIICNWSHDGKSMLQLIREMVDPPPLIIHSMMTNDSQFITMPPGVRWVDKGDPSALIAAVEDALPQMRESPQDV